MINYLRTRGVGPIFCMEMNFGSRLNLLTGDNGLGKSFILDIAWWSLTRRWPAEVNPALLGGGMVRPNVGVEGEIEFNFAGLSTDEEYTSTFSREDQAWKGRAGRPSNPGLVLYAMSDGSFALWDPHRNYWKTVGDADTQERTPAFVFRPEQVWDGLQDSEGRWLSNGLIRDWAGWQREGGKQFEQLKTILKALSPGDAEALKPGSLMRVSIDDVRDVPSIVMPYGDDVPVVHLSSGMRRIIALAYVLVWAWGEHQRAAEQLNKSVTPKITMLVDEVESHLHPRWQSVIVPALLGVMDGLADNTEVQLIAATHSPLILASVEQLFDEEKDAWFDLDFVPQQNESSSFDPPDGPSEPWGVVLTHRRFEKQGDAASWLRSEAFDQEGGGRSVEAQRAIEQAGLLLEKEDATAAEVEAARLALVSTLPVTDDYLLVWRHICERKGWLS